MNRRNFLLSTASISALPFIPAVPVEALPSEAMWASSANAGSTIGSISYNVWAIRNAAGVIDMMMTYDTEPPALPDGWDYYTRLGPYEIERTSGDLKPFPALPPARTI